MKKGFVLIFLIATSFMALALVAADNIHKVNPWTLGIFLCLFCGAAAAEAWAILVLHVGELWKLRALAEFVCDLPKVDLNAEVERWLEPLATGIRERKNTLAGLAQGGLQAVNDSALGITRPDDWIIHFNQRSQALNETVTRLEEEFCANYDKIASFAPFIGLKLKGRDWRHYVPAAPEEEAKAS